MSENFNRCDAAKFPRPTAPCARKLSLQAACCYLQKECGSNPRRGVRASVKPPATSRQSVVSRPRRKYGPVCQIAERLLGCSFAMLAVRAASRRGAERRGFQASEHLLQIPRGAGSDAGKIRPGQISFRGSQDVPAGLAPVQRNHGSRCRYGNLIFGVSRQRIQHAVQLRLSHVT